MKKSRCVNFILILSLLLSFFNFAAFAVEEADSEIVVPEQIESNISLPGNLRGVIISPGVDFLTNENLTEEEIAGEIDAICKKSSDIGLNAMIVKTSFEEKLCYNTEINETGELDVLNIAMSVISQNNMRCFLVYDIGGVLKNAGDTFDIINYLITETHKFALKYPCDGIIFDNYYLDKSRKTFNKYMTGGAGIGYENWLYEADESYIQTLSDIIKLTDNTVSVGLMLNDMWANSENNVDGSKTNDSFEALYDGFADTKKYIESGFADFAIVRAYGSTADASLPFEEVVSWWDKACQNGKVPLYVVHYNEKIGTQNAGWGAEDQLLRQLSTAGKVKSYSGSAFNSFKSLSENPLNSTKTLSSYFENNINEETLFEDLEMLSPKQQSFTTLDPAVKFMGTFDENFDVYFNGGKVKLNEAGYFYFEKSLKIGKNSFTITHKGQTVNYNIERKIIPLKSIDSSISEGKNLTLDGNTKLIVSATAYKGASVTASINGTTIKLKESQSTETDDSNSYYSTYTGRYTIPNGIIGQTQALGKITVTASYSGYSKSIIGASVTVNAEPEPPPKIEAPDLSNQNSVGTGEIVATMEALISSDVPVKLVKLNSDYTFVYNPKTTGAVLSPDFGQLPGGTVDYYKSSSDIYYITESGKRFNKEDATIIDGYGFGQNNLVVKSVGSNGGDSYIKIGLDSKTSYNVEVVGNNYYSDIDGDYYLKDFTASYVYITFDNVTSVTKLPSFENNLVFSAGKWETVQVGGVPKFCMILQLRNTGVYRGNGATYDSDGDLLLTFQNPTSSLSNMNIVIDPGHGFGKSATISDPGAIGHCVEFEANLGVAKALESELRAMGANVYRLKTESEYLPTLGRTKIARQYYNCDMFISLHSNSAGQNEDARGVEAYYFTSYSQPLASYISANIASYFQSNVYSDGANKDRGSRYSYFWVTEQQDFPSVLVELGFVSNYEDAMAIADPTHQVGIAKAIANAVKQYISKY